MGAVRRGVGRWESVLHRQVGGLRAVRTVAAYKRVKQLPPPPGPWARYLLEEVLLKPAIGPGLRNAIRALPTIGDALAEAELADAFFRHFLSSAKMLALLASAAKAASFRRRLHAVRRQRAARLICCAMRRTLGRRAVSRLAKKHLWREVAATLSSSLRRRKPRAGGCGTEEAMAPRSPRLCGLSGLMGDLKDMGGALWGREASTCSTGTGEGTSTGGGGGGGGTMPRRQQSAPQLHREIAREVHREIARESASQQHASRGEDSHRAPAQAHAAERAERTRKRTPPLSPSAQPAHGLYSMSGLYSLTAVDEGSPRAQRRAEL